MEKLLFFTSYEVIVFGEWKKDDQMTLSFDYGVGLLRELIISEAVPRNSICNVKAIHAASARSHVTHW